MIIFNDTEYGKFLYKKGFQTKQQLSETRYICKYLLSEGFNSEEVEIKLHHFFRIYKDNYSFNRFYRAIEDIIKSCQKSIWVVDYPVYISKKEMDVIEGYKDKNVQRILFAYLVMAKHIKNNYSSERYYVPYPQTDMCKLVSVKWKESQRLDNFHKLTYDGLFTPALNRSMIVNYVDEEASSENYVMSFIPSKDMIVNLHEYQGKQIIICESCGKKVEKRCNRQVRCDECSKLQNLERANNRYRKK